MKVNSPTNLKTGAQALLQKLIACPSFSGEENETATLIDTFFKEHHIDAYRHKNNIYAKNKYFSEAKPTILLNSHHDTVRPNKDYSKDPFDPVIQDGKLYGLGSNDAGGALVSIISAFLYYYEQKDLNYNLIIAATAEEEISGSNGIEGLLPLLGNIDCAIVGEPTKMEMAVAEKGLLVVDCEAKGKAGHAAREEGINSIYIALKDIDWIRTYHFPNISPLLGEVKMTVTSINTENRQHNVIPSQCAFVVDVRVNELYTLEEVLDTINKNLKSKVTARSLRIRSSVISLAHPLVNAGLKIGKNYYGSPTTSDKALIPYPTLKIGPGDSARSHTADEYIYINEICEGFEGYIQILNEVLK